MQSFLGIGEIAEIPAELHLPLAAGVPCVQKRLMAGFNCLLGTSWEEVVAKASWCHSFSMG